MSFSHACFHRFQFLAAAVVALAATSVIIQRAGAQENPSTETSDPVGSALIGAPNTWRPSQGPLPSLDVALAKAVESNPEIAAAKAKVALAEAELNAKRIEASRQILVLYSSLKNAEMQADVLKAKLKSAAEILTYEKQRYESGTGSVSLDTVAQREAEISEIKGHLMQNSSARDEAEKELRMRLGSAPPPNDFRSSTGATASGGARRLQVPQGPVVERIKSILDETTDLQFADNPQPLKTVAEYVSDKHKLPIYFYPNLDPMAVTIDLNLKQVPLRYAMEAIQEVAQGEVNFVVRDYGILVVPKEIAEQNHYVSAVDFGRGEPSVNVPVKSVPHPIEPPRQGSNFEPAKSRGQPTNPKPASDHDVAPRPSSSRPEDPFGPPAKSSVDRGSGPANKPSNTNDPFGR